LNDWRERGRERDRQTEREMTERESIDAQKGGYGPKNCQK
jgi:hypothetical protein